MFNGYMVLYEMLCLTLTYIVLNAHIVSTVHSIVQPANANAVLLMTKL